MARVLTISNVVIELRTNLRWRPRLWWCRCKAAECNESELPSAAWGQNLGDRWKPKKVLQGEDASEASFNAAADAALRDAKPLRDNAFKVELAKRTLKRALKVVTQST